MSSSEVAVFIDDNQFGSGQSTMKCGPEAVSLFWHSVAPGQHNPYTADDVHSMAHLDYMKFIGPDVISDQMGTSVSVLYEMLSYHGFAYEGGANDIGWVKSILQQGYPVIVGGLEESSVVDLDLGKGPYNWNTAGLTHIILATGIGSSGELLVRDTANIGSQGIVRPGPRRYDASRLVFSSATKVVPSWPVSPPVDWRAQAKTALASLTEAVNHL